MNWQISLAKFGAKAPIKNNPEEKLSEHEIDDGEKWDKWDN